MFIMIRVIATAALGNVNLFFTLFDNYFIHLLINFYCILFCFYPYFIPFIFHFILYLFLFYFIFNSFYLFSILFHIYSYYVLFNFHLIFILFYLISILILFCFVLFRFSFLFILILFNFILFYFRQDNGTLLASSSSIYVTLLFQFSKVSPIRARIYGVQDKLRTIDKELTRIRSGNEKEIDIL